MTGAISFLGLSIPDHFFSVRMDTGKMTVIAKVSLCLLILTCSLNAQAPDKELTLSDCLALARSAPSSFTRSQRDINVAKFGVAGARAAFLPQAQIGSSFVYNSPAMAGEVKSVVTPGTFVSSNGVREYQALASATAEIDTSGRLRAALDRAKADQKIAESSAIISYRDLKRAVTSAYYRLLLTRHLVDVENELAKEADEFAARVRNLYASGEIPRYDLVKATAQLARFRAGVTATEAQAKAANYDLASFWTEDIQAPLRVADTLATKSPPPPLMGQPFLQRPEYALFAAEERGFKADARRTRDGLYPQIGMTFEYGIDANRIAWRDRGSALFLSLNVPLFDWFRLRNAARQFDFRARQIQIDRQAATRMFNRDYQQALTAIKALSGEIDAVNEQVAALQDNLKLATLRYEGGESPALEVVDAQNQLAQAQVDHYTLLFNYEMAKADLEVASGK
jgi:outer membrane protein TolC